MSDKLNGLGKAIIDGIIRDGLVRAEEANLCVWQANAAEQIEAIAADWQENAEPCDYLSTHTFYGRNHRHSTALLRRCGFNVTCANWDEPNDQGQLRREGGA